MPELKLCPHCLGANIYVRGHSNCQVTCRACGMEGPEPGGESAAITAWNALPRALTWTTEPPKVLPGFYFLKMASGTIYMVYLAEADLMHNDWHGAIGQWVANAGPITPPGE